MKITKKIIAAVLSGCIILSLCGCHGKDEVALTINDTEITSALYLNALLEADSEARQRVDEEIASKNTSSDNENTKETDYFAQKVDGLSYSDYVVSKTIERCKEYVFYQELVEDKKIKLTDEEKSEAESYAEYYWNYGASSVYEANGVSLDTYKKAFTYTYYSNAYFMSLYGKDGEKEVAQKDIIKTMTEKFALVYTLATSYTEETTDDEKKATKAKFKEYAKQLENGKDFEDIYIEYHKITDEQLKEQEKAEAESKEETAKDRYASIIGDEDTDYSDENFETVYDMKKGEVKLIEGDDNACTIYVKLDITEDKYYLNSLNDSILYILKQEDFDKLILKKTTDFKVDNNKFATNRFKVKKIKYPETNA